ncbi:Retrovirus-related Pol polyprotein from transposon TNT 1-94 [Nymphaea thermarum]|nr:Retrovirus-related Pol polyprotein from transposon TNT 1-94 [Nymphaea thermarum]
MKKNEGRCGKSGHIKKNCRTKFPSKKGNNSQGNYNRRKPQEDSDREVICVVSECLFADGDLTGWWVDSGATHHIAKTKEGVIHMENLSLKTHKVYMGNNSYCDVMGIGTYRLNVGGTSVVLNEVLYVPSMRRNLVSVPALTGKDEQSGNEPTGGQSGNEPTEGQFGNEPTEQESSEEQSGNEPTEDQGLSKRQEIELQATDEDFRCNVSSSINPMVPLPLECSHV